MTWADLIAEVRAQIDVTDDQAYEWLLDRARVMNAEAKWLLREVPLVAVAGLLDYPLPPDCLSTEAVTVNTIPYRRSTLPALDVAQAVHGSRRPLYTDGVDAIGTPMIALYPPPSDGATITLRYLADVTDDRSSSPPFPADIHRGLSDGAIAMGLARMDERFDSAGYFDARFSDATNRLKTRRNSHVGRGGIPIPVISR